MKKISITLYTFFIFFFFITSPLKSTQIIETVFGKVEVKDPLIEKLLDSKTVKRLKYIDQSGTLHYFGLVPQYTRYSHSLGVYALLKLKKAPFLEQVAGLLHDTSHTVFSHVADSLFKSFSNIKSYQDDIHEWFLGKTDLVNILKHDNIEIHDVYIKDSKFPLLEQDLPKLCADRIEYTLHTGLIFGILTQKEIQEILNSLEFNEQNQWFFSDLTAARKLGYLSLHLTENFFGTPWNYALYHWSAQLLRKALELKIITLQTIHFGTDIEVFTALKNSKNATIVGLLKKCQNPFKFYEITKENDPNAHHVTPKFRGIDPLVSVGGVFQPLSSVDSRFKKEFQKVKQLMTEGFRIKLID